MMNPQIKANSTANTLSILLFIYAGIQSLFALLFVLIILLYGVGGVMAVVQGGKDAVPGAAVMLVFVFIYALLVAIGIAAVVLNIKAGRQLRNSSPASKNLLLASSIGNLLSCMCGGLCLAPFGIALGVFGLWFTLSDTGTAYFAGGITTPPQIDQYNFQGSYGQDKQNY
ncbi:MAG TPA: hypothetical protein VK612_09260, partial [Pyrinomonadaceae bacterium]|nr:hypothetical protein [Pyrinomonadaceae bacterium]